MRKKREGCLHCGDPLLPLNLAIMCGDVSLAESTKFPDKKMHHVCFFRTVIGGVNHIRKLCRCFGGIEPDGDLPGFSKREAALHAWIEYKKQQSTLKIDSELEKRFVALAVQELAAILDDKNLIYTVKPPC